MNHTHTKGGAGDCSYFGDVSFFISSRGDLRTPSRETGDDVAGFALLLAGLPELPRGVGEDEGGENLRGRFRDAGTSDEGENRSFLVGVT